MTKKDDIQTAINRASLRQLQAEDVARACLAAEVHPSITTILMTLHHQNVQLDNDCKALRANMMELAKVVARSADVSAISHLMMAAMAERLGLDPSSLVEASNAEGG